MMRLLGTALGIVALSGAQPASKSAFEREVTVGTPFVAGSLTVFPLVPKSIDDAEYLTLEEAFAAKVLAVHEVNPEGSVNALFVTNGGDKPIYAMAGELLLGGKQDRIIGQTTVIPPRTKRLRVTVFCVEHGRWSGRELGFASGNAMGHVTLRKQAMFRDQGEVWSEVANSNERLATKSATDTYRHAAKKLESETWARTLEILKRLDATPGAGGIAAAIGGRVVGVEYFRSPALFRRLRAKMVRSYVAESLQAPGGAGAVSAADVVAFMSAAETARATRTKDGKASQSIDFENDAVLGEHVHDKAKAEPVMKSYFAR